MDCEPLIALLPDQAPEAMHDAAFVADQVKVELLPDSPIAMDENLRFAIREGGRTVGSGVVIKILQ